MTRFRVFLGAPPAHDLATRCDDYHWRTVAIHPPKQPPPSALTPDTLEHASRRISLAYQDAIFLPGDEEDSVPESEGSDDGGDDGLETRDEHPTTLISWPATTQDDHEDTRSRLTTFLYPSQNVSRFRSQLGTTQDTQETASFEYSDASSIARFPAFHFNLHGLTSISALIAHAREAHAPTTRRETRKVSILAAVLEVEGPDAIRVKKGADAGKQVYVLKLILGDEAGGISRLTAWREVAEAWGGVGIDPTVDTHAKKGDIVLLENVLAVWEPAGEAAGIPVTFTASPHQKPRLEVCFRALPSAPRDARFRPDLRLGQSDAGVRKVAAVVRWFEGLAGLDSASPY